MENRNESLDSTLRFILEIESLNSVALDIADMTASDLISVLEEYANAPESNSPEHPTNHKTALQNTKITLPLTDSIRLINILREENDELAKDFAIDSGIPESCLDEYLVFSKGFGAIVALYGAGDLDRADEVLMLLAVKTVQDRWFAVKIDGIERDTLIYDDAEITFSETNAPELAKSIIDTVEYTAKMEMISE